MANPSHVTVIIPTRERFETLRSTLATCTEQDSDRLEILVCDNQCTDGTEGYVKNHPDPRVRHIRTPERLSMAKNWEYALSHMSDGFVIVLGDDDALLPNAISELLEVADQTGCQAMAWTQGGYNWPQSSDIKEDNVLTFPVRREWTERRSFDSLTSVLRYENKHKLLPSLYWGMVHRDVLTRATAKDGRFFHSLNPDVYSAAASAAVVETYQHCSGPYSLSGRSKFSTGMSFMGGRSDKSTLKQFLSEDNLPFHPDLLLVPSIPIYVTECCLQARDHVPNAQLPPIDYDQMLFAAMNGVSMAPEHLYESICEAVLEIGDRIDRRAVAEEAIARHPHAPLKHTVSPAGLNVRRGFMKIYGDDVGIRDVHGAAHLCHNTIKLLEKDYLSFRGIAASMAKRTKQAVDNLTDRMARK